MQERQRVRRVALIPSSYHPYFGGVEEHARHVARHLRDEGVAVEIWTVDRGEHLGVQQVDGITVRYLPTPLPARAAGALARFGLRGPAALWAWVRAVRRFRPDVLHVHCFGPNGLYALALARVTRLPLVVTSHGETTADDHGVFDRSALLRAGLRAAIARAACVTAPARGVIADLQENYGAGSSALVVPNGVDLWYSSRPTGPDRGEARVIVAAGRLERVKGFDLVIRALTSLPSAVSLHLLGDGGAKAALEDLAGELHLRDRVHFLGRQDSAEVREQMAAGDVVVVPSRKEAFGIVCLEAWASGTPLVATNRGGPADYVTDGVDGLLVDPEDVEALAERIRRVLRDGGLADALAAAGRRRVQDFSWSRVTDAYRSIYETVAVD